MAGKKIIVAGHICLDITPVFPAGSPQPLNRLLAPGKLVQMAGVDLHTGGAVANTGLALKILGAEVELMGKVGDDDFGRLILERLRQYDAAEGMIVSPDSTTSYSIVIAPPGTDRIFLHNPGANDTFRADDIDPGKLTGAAWFHFGYPPLMRHMYAEDGAELAEIFRRAKAAGLHTSLDMAAVDPGTDAGQADWTLILRRVLRYVDCFVPSVEELCFMADRPRYERWLRRAEGGDVTAVLDLDADIRPLARQVLALGAHELLIKCGAPGRGTPALRPSSRPGWTAARWRPACTMRRAPAPAVWKPTMPSAACAPSPSWTPRSPPAGKNSDGVVSIPEPSACAGGFFVHPEQKLQKYCTKIGLFWLAAFAFCTVPWYNETSFTKVGARGLL